MWCLALLSGCLTGPGRVVLSHSSVYDVDGDLRAFSSNQEARGGVVWQSHAGCAQKERLVIEEKTHYSLDNGNSNKICNGPVMYIKFLA